MKSISIHIEPSKNYKFDFGNCATIAISQGFGIPFFTLRCICESFKWKKWREGITFNQCRRLINFLSKQTGDKAEYISNKAGIKYYQFVTLFNKGKWIVMFDEHLSYCENGIIYDSWLDDMTKSIYTEGRTRLKVIIYKVPPVGWWKIS